MEHARSVVYCNGRYCSKGMRKFAEKHNIDYTKFLKEGLDEEILLATNDAMAIKVVEAAWAAAANKQ